MWTRKVKRPTYEQLIEETTELGFSAVGRKYGVSDNAVRKWIRWYEAAARGDESRRDTA
jgi:transposase-like protein